MQGDEVHVGCLVARRGSLLALQLLGWLCAGLLSVVAPRRFYVFGNPHQLHEGRGRAEGVELIPEAFVEA
eukprot:12610369-Alexandrium_andersonii.AAC.1